MKSNSKNMKNFSNVIFVLNKILMIGLIVAVCMEVFALIWTIFVSDGTTFVLNDFITVKGPLDFSESGLDSTSSQISFLAISLATHIGYLVMSIFIAKIFKEIKKEDTPFTLSIAKNCFILGIFAGIAGIVISAVTAISDLIMNGTESLISDTDLSGIMGVLIALILIFISETIKNEVQKE